MIESRDPIIGTGDSDSMLEDTSIEHGAPEAEVDASSREQEAIETGSASSASGRAGESRLSRIALGSVLLAVDTVNERLQEIEEPEPDAGAGERPPDSVLIPRSEWGERFGETSGRTARYLMIGMADDAQATAGRGGKALLRVGNFVVGAAGSVLGPLFRSRPFSPPRQGFESLIDRGESRVDRWIRVGRERDTRSRAFAETAINQIADDSMDEVIENERIQVFIQDIVEQQSLGFIDESIEEVRERTVSSDIVAEQIVRNLFRRTPRQELPRSPFRRLPTRATRGVLASELEHTMLYQYAGFASRFVAFVVDLILIVLILTASTWFLSTVITFFGLGDIYQQYFGAGTSLGSILAAVASVYGSATVIAYLLFFWIFTGQTPGMILLGLKVVKKDGSRLSFWAGVRRLIGYFISALILFLGFIWILGDDHRQGWHDKLAGTYVIYSWPARPEENFLELRTRYYEDHTRS